MSVMLTNLSGSCPGLVCTALFALACAGLCAVITTALWRAPAGFARHAPYFREYASR